MANHSKAPYNARNEEIHEEVTKYRIEVRLLGYAALTFAVLAFFLWPYVLGIIAIILGFVAQRKGEITLGAWSIGLAALAIVLKVFIYPIF